ncbi:MAG: endonuclease/exonuclease/phosphatase family protein [Chloroflexota bacterium]
MNDRPSISTPSRWLVSILIWYMLFIVVYLLGRFVVPVEWRFIAFLNNVAPYLFFPVIIGLLISLLLRAPRLSGVYLLASLVGVLWIGPALSAPFVNPPSADPDAETLQVISFNVQPDNANTEAAVDWLLGFQPEILALQDMPAPEDFEAFDALIEAYPYQATRQERSGVALFSQYPIVEAEDIMVNESPVQRAVLDIAGREVVVYNIHAWFPLNDNEGAWLPLRYDESERNQQIRDLLDIIADDESPVLLIGDLNLTEWSPIYHRIAAQLTDGYRSSSWGTGATWPVGDGTNEDLGRGYPRLFRLDYVWHSDDITSLSATVGAPLGSDHLPLIVDIAIP